LQRKYKIMTLKIDLPEPYEEMLEELRERGGSDPDADLRQLTMEAIHNGYQEMQDA